MNAVQTGRPVRGHRGIDRYLVRRPRTFSARVAPEQQLVVFASDAADGGVEELSRDCRKPKRTSGTVGAAETKQNTAEEPSCALEKRLDSETTRP